MCLNLFPLVSISRLFFSQGDVYTTMGDFCSMQRGGSIKSVLHVEERPLKMIMKYGRAFDLSDNARNSGSSLVVITLRSQGLNSVVKSSETKTETHLGCSLNRFTYFSMFLGMPVKGSRGRFWLAQGKWRIGKGRRLPSLGKGAKVLCRLREKGS